VLIKNVLEKLAPIREKRIRLESEMGQVKESIFAGIEKARREAVQTMKEVRSAVGLSSIR